MTEAPIIEAPIAGLVLAGGQASRMGGVDKGLQMLRGRSLLGWVLNRLEPQVMSLMISANAPDKYAGFGLPVIADDMSSAGPLAGMLAGLKNARHPLLVTAPCDAPFLPADLVSRLFTALEADQADLAVVRTDDGLQPMFSLLRRRVLPALEGYLRQGGRKADGWHDNLRVVEVPYHDQPQAFININSLDELHALNMSSANHPGGDDNA